MLPRVLSNPELKRSTDVIYSAVCKELCIALVEEMDGAGIRAAAHTSAQPSHGPGATRFSGSFPQPCSPPCSAFSRENTAELAHLCACKAQQKPVKHPGAAALSRLLTLRAHPDSHPTSPSLRRAACLWLTRLSIPCPGLIRFISLAGPSCAHTLRARQSFSCSTLAGCLRRQGSGEQKGKGGRTGSWLCSENPPSRAPEEPGRSQLSK